MVGKHKRPRKRKEPRTNGRSGRTASARSRAIPSIHSKASLPERSQFARDRALHVLSAMRRDSNLSLTRAAKLEGIKAQTVKKYFSSALKLSKGKFRATKGDRYSATLYIPDSQGNSVPINTRSSKEREQVSKYLRDLGRYLRGDRDALLGWRGKKIAGVALVVDGYTIVGIEPAHIKDRQPIRTARRKARQQERESQGIAVSPCVFCIQDHHTAFRRHDPQLTAPLCEMHHRMIHEQLMQAGISPHYEPDKVKRVALALRSAAVYDRDRADAMERWAGLLEQLDQREEEK
jgi:hypothetical protein